MHKARCSTSTYSLQLKGVKWCYCTSDLLLLRRSCKLILLVNWRGDRVVGMQHQTLICR